MELQWVDVLELVDEEMSELPPLHGCEVTVVAHRVCALDEHVVEVDQRAFALQPFVALVDRRHDRRCERRAAARVVARGRVGTGVDHARLRPFDLGSDIGGLHVLRLSAALGRLADQRREQPGLAVEQRRGSGAGLGPPLAQLREGDRVERARDGLTAQAQRAESTVQLGRGLSGERDDEDVPGVGGGRRQSVRDATGEHPGLARARPRDDAERRTRARDCGALLGVEVVEERGLVTRGSGVRRHGGHLREGVVHWRRRSFTIPRGCGKAP